MNIRYVKPKLLIRTWEDELKQENKKLMIKVGIVWFLMLSFCVGFWFLMFKLIFRIGE